MTKFSLTLIFIFCLNYCFSQYQIPLEYIDNRYLADSLYKAENYSDALETYKTIIDSDFHRRLDYLYLTKCYYETGHNTEAKKIFTTVIEKGAHFNSLDDSIYCYDTTYNTVLNYLAKPDWQNYRKLLIENSKNYFANIQKNEILAKELILRVEIENKIFGLIQKYPEIDSLKNQLQNIRIENQKVLESEIELNGFPSISTIGEEAVSSAFFIVLHSDHNVEFQENCLKLMIELYKNGEIPAVYIAYLQDRILINNSENQIFGTQFVEIENKISLKPVIDIEKLNKRRKVMQLDKSNKYLENVKGKL